MRRSIGILAIVFLLSGGLLGCASTGGSPQDPLEPLNRAIFGFNEKLDEAVLQPVARGYRAALPQMVRTGVGNFFGNIEDVWIGINNILQGKVADGVQDLARCVFNTTFGLLGVVDASTDFNLPKHSEDFGQTLGRWGLDSGPYLVLPLFGPSSVRDGVGFLVDMKADPVRNLSHVPSRNALYATRTINTRARLLDIGRIAEEAALDKYRFIRESYFQRRRSQVYDGDPPRRRESSELEIGEEPRQVEYSPDNVRGMAINGVTGSAGLLIASDEQWNGK